MKLYLISQNENDNYDTYDSAVVCAKNENEAKLITPGGAWGIPHPIYPDSISGAWCSGPSMVSAQYIGIASNGIKPGTIIITSFNAG